MNSDIRIQRHLSEINIYRRLIIAWCSYQPEKDDLSSDSNSVKFCFLLKHIGYAVQARFVIRLYALLEKKEKRFTFSYWLEDKKKSEAVNYVIQELSNIYASNGYKKLNAARNRILGHNQLDLKTKPDTSKFSEVINLSKLLEDLYDKVVDDGQAISINWTGEFDSEFVNRNNCHGGIEKNVNDFFTYLFR